MQPARTEHLPEAVGDTVLRICPQTGETVNVTAWALWRAYDELWRARRAGPFVDPVCASYSRRGFWDTEPVTVTSVEASEVLVVDNQWLGVLHPDAPVTVTHPDFRYNDALLALTVRARDLRLRAAPTDGRPSPG